MEKTNNSAKKNIYFAVIAVTLLLSISLAVADYDASKASHETLYTNTIEPKELGGDGNIAIMPGSGKIGIGLADPIAKLHVEMPGRAGTDHIFSLGKDGGYGTSNFYQYYVGDKEYGLIIGESDTDYTIKTNLDKTKKETYFNGNVGIGTTSPGYALDVAGAMRAKNANHQIRLYDTDTGVDEWTITTYYDEGLAFYENGANNRMVLTGNGKLGIGANSPGHALDVVGAIEVSDGIDQGVIEFRGDRADTRIFEHDYILEAEAPSGVYLDFDSDDNGGNFRVYDSDSEVMRIIDGGNVGIGTTSPGSKLEVSGDIKINGNIYRDDGTTDLRLYADSDIGEWSLLRSHKGEGIAIIGESDVVGLAVSRVNSNVGIGTTAPLRKLDVRNGAVIAGTASATQGTLQFAGYYSGSGGLDILNTYGSGFSSGATVIGYAVKPKFKTANAFVSSAENVAHPKGALVVHGAGLEYLNAPGAVVDRDSEVAMTSRFKVAANGDVGIGTASPEALLHLKGNAKQLRLSSTGDNQADSNSIAFEEGTTGQGIKLLYDGASPGDGGLKIQNLKDSADLVTIGRDGNVTIEGNITIKGNITFGKKPRSAWPETEIIRDGAGYDGQSGHTACASIGKRCVTVMSTNHVADVPFGNCCAAADICARAYGGHSVLPGVVVGSHSNFHSCYANIGHYITYLDPGILRCDGYFSAVCE